MPMYDFKCDKCGTLQERIAKSDALESPPCLKCKSTSMEKQLSAPGSIKFKDPGFYETDYKHK